MLAAFEQTFRRHFLSFSFKRRNFAAHLIPVKRGFHVLALESSADDTCAAVVTSERDILSNVVIKQLDL